MGALWNNYIVPDAPGQLVISFDQVGGEAHERSAEVTDHPVETGSNIADHVRQNPKTLTLELYITNTPSNILSGRGQYETIQLQVPAYAPPLEPTPGSVFRSARQAIADAISGGPQATKITVLDFPAPFDRIKETQTALDALIDAGGACSVVTSLFTYTSMAITRISTPRKEPGGVTFTIDFKTVNTVASLSVTAPQPLEKRGAPAVKKGAQSPKPVGANDATSLANKILTNIQSLISGGSTP